MNFLKFIILLLVFSSVDFAYAEGEVQLTKYHKKALNYDCKKNFKKKYSSTSQCKKLLTAAIKKNGELIDVTDFDKDDVKNAQSNCAARVKKGLFAFNSCLAKKLNVEIIIEDDPIVVVNDGSGDIETDPVIVKNTNSVYDLVLPATYFLIASDGKDTGGGAQGTAVGIKPNYFATNCHVVENDDGSRWFKELLMIQVDEDFAIRDNWYEMKVIKSDKTSDRCIIHNDKIDNAYVEVKRVIDIELLEKVVAVGNPEGFPGVITEGEVQRVYKVNTPLPVGIDGALIEMPVEIIQSNTHIRHGNSGGGLYDLNGKLIGITTFGQGKLKDGDDTYRETNPFNFSVAAERFMDLYYQ